MSHNAHRPHTLYIRYIVVCIHNYVYMTIMNSAHSVSALLVKWTMYPWSSLASVSECAGALWTCSLGGYIHTASIVNCVPVFGKLTNIDIGRYFIGHTTGRVILLSPPAN